MSSLRLRDLAFNSHQFMQTGGFPDSRHPSFIPGFLNLNKMTPKIMWKWSIVGIVTIIINWMLTSAAQGHLRDSYLF